MYTPHFIARTPLRALSSSFVAVYLRAQSSVQIPKEKIKLESDYLKYVLTVTGLVQISRKIEQFTDKDYQSVDR